MSGKGVDERILSMKFDNASFEKNAKVTINTLDKLQRSIDTSKLSKDISYREELNLLNSSKYSGIKKSKILHKSITLFSSSSINE